jgi:hypothetical protein
MGDVSKLSKSDEAARHEGIDHVLRFQLGAAQERPGAVSQHRLALELTARNDFRTK